MEWQKSRALLIFCLLMVVFLTGCTVSPPAEQVPPEQEPAYNISDYYNSDGSFSALALALEEGDSGRKLDVVRGDHFVVGNQSYEVAAESFTVIFYTFPSHDHATEWWNEYFETAADNGIVTVVE